MACWRCPACGNTVCYTDECPTCNGNGRSVKRLLNEQRQQESVAALEPKKFFGSPVGRNKSFFDTQLGIPFDDPNVERCEICGRLTKGRLIPRELGKRRVPFCGTCFGQGFYVKYEPEYIYKGCTE